MLYLSKESSIPTENERKWILNLDCEQEIHSISKKLLIINQGYITASKGMSLRLRKSQTGIIYNTCCFMAKPESIPKHYMTFKCSAGGRVVEIEKRIDERDFNDLWMQCLNKLVKVRYLARDDKKQLWEIDFFKTHNDANYFAMAELEMPEGQEKPLSIPKFIKKNLLHEVSLTDCRFSSKLIADVRYATELYATLEKKHVLSNS